VKLSKEFKIGLVVVCSVVAFIWGISFLKGSELFSRKYYLYALYPKIDNLIPANPVLIKGYKIGQINNISLFSKGGEVKVLVKFLLTEDIQIPKNSIARAISSDLLGTKAVEIIFSKNSTFVESGDTLIAETEQGLKESFNKQLAPIQAKAENLIGSIDSVMTVAKLMLNAKNRENIDKSFESVRRAILTLEQTAYKMDNLIGSERAKMSSILSNLNNVTTNLSKNEGKINNIINNVSNLSDTLAKSQLKSAIANADKTVKELNILLSKINDGQGTLGKLAKNDSLYNNLNKSAENLDKFLKDLKENPKRYVHFSIFGRKERKQTKN
jgi:phospholipid/cholesterol/gamma-HCH transport system substrate-binding protein